MTNWLNSRLSSLKALRLSFFQPGSWRTMALSSCLSSSITAMTRFFSSSGWASKSCGEMISLSFMGARV